MRCWTTGICRTPTIRQNGGGLEMSRKRYLSPKFFANETLAEIEPLGRILFQGLWCFADRNGCLEYRPKRLKVEVLPYDGTVPDVVRWLDQMAELGLISFYEVDSTRYIQVVNFLSHQSPHPGEKALYPDPAIICEKQLAGNLPASCQQVADSLPVIAGNGADHLPEALQPIIRESETILTEEDDGRKASIRAEATSSPLKVAPVSPLECRESDNQLLESCQKVSSRLSDAYQHSFNSNYNFKDNRPHGVLHAHARARARDYPPEEASPEIDPEIQKLDRIEKLVIEVSGVQPMNSTLEGQIRRTVGELNHANVNLDQFGRFVKSRTKAQALNFIVVNFLQWLANEERSANGSAGGIPRTPDRPQCSTCHGYGTVANINEQGKAKGRKQCPTCKQSETIVTE